MPVLSGIPNFDKVVHFGLYAVEAFFLYQAVRWAGRAGFSLARVLAVVGALAVWGVADEVHQSWIPGRWMEGEDVAADLAGAGIGAIVASFALKTPRGARDAPAPQDDNPARPRAAGGASPSPTG